MKLTPAEIERSLETPVENEVQLALRRILGFWGPNGEHHLVCGDSNVGSCGEYGVDERCCAIVAHWRCSSYESLIDDELKEAMLGAASELGFKDYHDCSASSFANGRRMVERAIELAA